MQVHSDKKFEMDFLDEDDDDTPFIDPASRVSHSSNPRIYKGIDEEELVPGAIFCPDSDSGSSDTRGDYAGKARITREMIRTGLRSSMSSPSDFRSDVGHSKFGEKTSCDIDLEEESEMTRLREWAKRDRVGAPLETQQFSFAPTGDNFPGGPLRDSAMIDIDEITDSEHEVSVVREEIVLPSLAGEFEAFRRRCEKKKLAVLRVQLQREKFLTDQGRLSEELASVKSDLALARENLNRLENSTISS
jgi:hypothetical protein